MTVRLDAPPRSLFILKDRDVIKEFEDRSDKLFGREADVQSLLDRAETPGVTALVAPPLMGKTWTLNEVARRLSEGDQYLVGYYESMAAESSALLYAVSNLYERWLSDASMRKQALSLWHRHKKDLVPRVGQMAGKLFGKLAANQLPQGVAAIVSEAFYGLASAQEDLLKGGLKLPKLPYDQALSLTKLVATISERRVVLILDAWEKSRSFDEESATLEAFLKHRNDWPHTHVFLAIRSPGQDSTQENKDARSRAENLCGLCPAAKVVRLRRLNLTDAREQARVESYVRDNVPAAKQVKTQTLIQMIDGYPGVLNFWVDQATSPEMQTENDLHREARNAHSAQYPEFNYLFNGLEEDQLTLAARLAFLPRLNAERWETFRPCLMKGLPDSAVDKLHDSGVLHYESFPTYGHDTRHAAARRWLSKNKRPLMVRTAKRLIEDLAAEIEGNNWEKDSPLLVALAACSDVAQQLKLNSAVLCLIDAAKSAYGDVIGVLNPSFDDAYQQALQLNPLLAPLLGIALYNRGQAKEDHRDFEGAIADYTAILELPGATPTMIPWVLCKRGMTKAQQGDTQGAIADCTLAIERPGATPWQIAEALTYRGISMTAHGNYDGAIGDYTKVIELQVAPYVQSIALCNRGRAHELRGEHSEAIADYMEAIKSQALPLDINELARSRLLNLFSSKGKESR